MTNSGGKPHIAHGWHSIKRELFVTVNAKSGNLKKKTEVLTANYPLEVK